MSAFLDAFGGLADVTPTGQNPSFVTHCDIGDRKMLRRTDGRAKVQPMRPREDAVRLGLRLLRWATVR
jgi:hypothetical protein